MELVHTINMKNKLNQSSVFLGPVYELKSTSLEIWFGVLVDRAASGSVKWVCDRMKCATAVFEIPVHSTMEKKKKTK